MLIVLIDNRYGANMVIHTHPRQDPPAVQRAKRLKQLREMTGLSREKFQQRHAISRGTLQNWETARFGGLTLKGANMIIQVMQAEGIITDTNWLMYGIGPSPEHTTQQTTIDLSSTSIKDMNAIRTLVHFRSLYKDVMDTIIATQDASPWLQKGDLVAGIRAHPNHYARFIKRFCIVHTSDHGLLVKQLGQTAEQVFYLASPHLTGNTAPVIYAPKIISLAPITWIWRNQHQPFRSHVTDFIHALTPKPHHD